jgi:hypothetical protein
VCKRVRMTGWCWLVDCGVKLYSVRNDRMVSVGGWCQDEVRTVSVMYVSMASVCVW